jgi:microcystin degradation protein MlrC
MSDDPDTQYKDGPLSLAKWTERHRLADFVEMEGWTVVPELSDPKKAKALADLIRRGKR